ncbi:hypothetical protein UCRPC4_g02360 [Phaeomoniella chlamydospora]|uniref:Uncharacterized protein n=1 Tax=Phaeomoniella chlamydospora TaxID=158046 RepID=A0A0G2EQQ9_PHACM|nr:hypothetical protein UCRPC4_g02360 [Phaeomoniella chlamydospora]
MSRSLTNSRQQTDIADPPRPSQTLSPSHGQLCLQMNQPPLARMSTNSTIQKDDTFFSVRPGTNLPSEFQEYQSQIAEEYKKLDKPTKKSANYAGPARAVYVAKDFYRRRANIERREQNDRWRRENTVDLTVEGSVGNRVSQDPRHDREANDSNKSSNRCDLNEGPPSVTNVSRTNTKFKVKQSNPGSSPSKIVILNGKELHGGMTLRARNRK